ncbi:MAG TPA: 50S ribosomal protein L23 [Gemmatimonadota bacterium]|nr:50S ribosomal protein L23 [Gemmatimonadota bacterium]
MSRPPERVVVRPVITEKSTRLQFDENRYAFEVARDATKPEIRRAVQELFDVRVVDVKTMNIAGKKRRVRYAVGRRPHWKKAVVTLADGDTIDVYEGV